MIYYPTDAKETVNELCDYGFDVEPFSLFIASSSSPFFNNDFPFNSISAHKH